MMPLAASHIRSHPPGKNTRMLTIIAVLAFLQVATLNCKGVTDAEDIPDVPEYQALSTENIPASAHLDVPVLMGRGPFCQITSLAMMIAYLDTTVTMSEVFAYSGLGAGIMFNEWHQWFRPLPETDPALDYHYALLQNFGIRFVIGAGDFPRGYLWFVEHAKGKLTYTEQADALKFLRAAVASGRPLQVHIDMGLLPSMYGSNYPEGSSHFVVVTGYDGEAVYLNDVNLPHAPDGYKHVRIPLEEFMNAWRAPGNFPEIFGWRAGPYYMLFFDQRSAGALERKSRSEILAMHKHWSRDLRAVFNEGINSDLTKTNWVTFGQVRESFADFLEENGNTHAADAYRIAVWHYYNMTQLPDDQIRSRINTVIIPWEEEARKRY